MSDRKDENELAVFRQFAAAARLPGIQPSSIEKRWPPEPDIRYQDHEGAHAVELVELLDEPVARDQGDGFALQSALTEALKGRPLPTLRGRLVRVRFQDDSSLSRKRAAVPTIIETLSGLPDGYLGDAPTPEHVQTIDVHRWAEGCEVLASVYAGGGWGTPVSVAKVAAKLNKSYTTDAPVELLAYYQRQHVASELWEHPNLCDLIRSGQATSPFRRIWVFDTWSWKIPFCHPRSSEVEDVAAPGGASPRPIAGTGDAKGGAD